LSRDLQFSKKVMRITKNVINKNLVIKIISNFANLLNITYIKFQPFILSPYPTITFLSQEKNY